MASVGLARSVQDDFSAGMFSQTTKPELIPANGLAGATNGLIDDRGGVYRRGGSSYFPGSTWPTSQILWVWQGTLTAGGVTLVATATTLYSVSGSGVTSIGSYAGMASGPAEVAVVNGTMYLPRSNQTYDGSSLGTYSFGDTTTYYTSVANRLVFGFGSTVKFSHVGDAGTVDSTDEWTIPDGATILGVTNVRDSCVVFTDRGTYVISNMALNLTDTDGNVQQRLDLYARDLRLWGTGAASVVGYGGGLIVPTQDGIWLMQLGVESEVAAPLVELEKAIQSDYRTYVRSGFVPGQAAIFQGHYFLPMIFGSPSVCTSMLVCKLAQPSRRGGSGPAWTSFNFAAGTSGRGARAVTVSRDGLALYGATEKTPFGTDSRMATLNYLDSSKGTKEADGGINSLRVTTRGFASGPASLNTFVKARVSYELTDEGTDNPTMAASFVPSGESAIPLTGTAPETSGGDPVHAWTIGKRGRFGSVMLEVEDPGPASISRVEVFSRLSGRV